MRGFLQNLKMNFIRFMQGRNGMDELGKALNIGVIILLVLSIFTKWSVFYILALALMVYMYFRVFSKNTPKRYAENQAFLKSTCKIRTFWASQKNMMRQRKTHHIYSCPECKQKIRIPRGKGKIEIQCPKCRTKFVKKS